MKRLLKKLEAAFAAAAFAEEGEVETARGIVAEAGRDDPEGGTAPGAQASRRPERPASVRPLRPGKVARSP